MSNPSRKCNQLKPPVQSMYIEKTWIVDDKLPHHLFTLCESFQEIARLLQTVTSPIHMGNPQNETVDKNNTLLIRS